MNKMDYTDAGWQQTGDWQPTRLAHPVHRTSRYLTMRDGVKIAIDLYLPNDVPAGQELPAILHQTRYYRRYRFRWPFDPILQRLDRNQIFLRSLVAGGYALVATDVRGSGASFGDRQMEFSPDEVKDGAEIVDWIIQQPWSDGQVASLGISYNGTTADMLLSNRHPAVKACIPMFAVLDIFADVLRPGGVFNRVFMQTWSKLNKNLDFDRLPAYAATAMGRLVGFMLKGAAPVDQDHSLEMLQAAMQAHSRNYDIYRLARRAEYRDNRDTDGFSLDLINPLDRLEDIEASGAAIYLWSSWLDGAFILANILQYLAMRNPSRRLILGPWDHGARQNLDPYAPDRKVRFNVTGEILRFLDYHLKGIETGISSEPAIHYYTIGEGTWKATPTWPPEGFSPVEYYLVEGRQLQPGQPPQKPGSDLYQVDHAATSGKPSRWLSQVNVSNIPIGYPDREEQDARLLVYESFPLTETTELTGIPILTLFLRCNQTDAQIFAYLEDVAPGGKATYVTEGCLRALHRKVCPNPPSFWLALSSSPVPYHTFNREDAEPLIPGEIACLAFHLQPASYLFRQGHRIRLALAGADADNFEIYPPDPPLIEVLWSKDHPSHVILPMCSITPG